MTSKFIKCKPSQQSAAFNSGALERIIRMVETPVDPLDPPKFKHKRVPKASGSLPVSIMRSPPRHATVKDQKEWKIPPCISNWKNRKGYIIPLDKRLAADGRGFQEVQISDDFANLSDALYVAEHNAREEIAVRSKILKELLLNEKYRKEQKLRALAQKARSERTGLAPACASASIGKSSLDGDDDDDMREEREQRLERDMIREERRRGRKRQRRLKAKDAAMGKKSKFTSDRDRDTSEKVALGMANTGAGKGGEAMYDQRLFNQYTGIECGFGADDQYNIYDKRLFTAQPTLSTLYRLIEDADSDTYGGADEHLEKTTMSERFKPGKTFTGTLKKPGKRDRPVEFDKPEDNDLFGLDVFLTQVKKGKNVMAFKK